jgi:hypothetical protein
MKICLTLSKFLSKPNKASQPGDEEEHGGRFGDGVDGDIG